MKKVTAAFIMGAVLGSTVVGAVAFVQKAEMREIITELEKAYTEENH